MQFPDPTKFKTLEEHEAQPQGLDVVLIDGRWGQLKRSHNPVLIKWLDKPEEFSTLDLKQYNRSKVLRCKVKDIKDRFTDDQISRIHYTAEQKTTESKLEVRVFGEYTKKTEDK